ncbi:MAG TPA: PPOX class F420-dependent oxidoreductase [Acidimicrobiales bacterium]|nr:PPOX class F420-dependent oxidoreductase [Acidimicrobiales bacterium]
MAKLTKEHADILRQPVLAHVATVNPDGTPQSTPVWVDTDGEAVIFNTAKGRKKTRNIERNPAVAISVTNPDNPYEMLEVQGRAELIEEGADEHIDKMAQKYLGQDTYPFRQPGEERVIVRVVPEKIAA